MDGHKANQLNHCNNDLGFKTYGVRPRLNDIWTKACQRLC
ncbi:hypothetical protein VCRA2128O305_40145 [Vibrio crassostreae]|nr:hypothetical protein VCRA2113O322_140027 [Vibrio crassostreae]CAK2048348.1 hypothetical protein VCRA2113O324_380017 [Vibrio crassostreae]CAK2064834.1 hypothetical protein VCRA2111O320_370017 [Vibrio crassostreae]CAK2097401.1 hypothetical protein VCRA2116O234_400041 [Vibrio crassostreae]CAK2158580.1 hypothetical protein VCRA2113O221_40222 [Vibrio crassostreae]